MTSIYDAELVKLAATYARGLTADVSEIMSAIAAASESSIIGVGSGGSHTVASLLCNLHESYTGRVSRPATSLELICNPNLAASSPAFLFSAEGKNPDIIEALLRARQQSSRTVHVITNRADSPLVTQARKLTNVATLVFDLPDKDGYLATNSLLFSAIVIARAYEELAQPTDRLPPALDDLRLDGNPIATWLADVEPFVAAVASRGALLTVYSPPLRPVAADLESKLSEAALLHCQLSDLRSFAHGRHLWLATRSTDIGLLALVEPHLRDLWTRTSALIPETVPTTVMPFSGTAPSNLLAGLVAQMWLVAAISHRAATDPGHPNVPQFGRDLHYLDLNALIPNASPPNDDHGYGSKLAVLGARWPSATRHGPVARARAAYTDSLRDHEFRALVFDYDGTLCPSGSPNPPPPRVLEKLSSLLNHGAFLGIASGRGGSVREDLEKTLPPSTWPQIRLALYGGGLLTELGTTDPTPLATSEFLSHVTRIVRQLESLGVPIQTIRVTLPFQVSVRFRQGVHTDQMWFVIADALRHAGLDISRVQRSAHSIDILADGIGKSRLIDTIIQELRIHPHEVLTMGDQGAWPGNDYSLLEHPFSLSVDLPSRRIDRGWALAPPRNRGVDATLWYLDRVELCHRGRFRLVIDNAQQDGHSTQP